MKVVSISLDPQLLNPESVAATRIALYGTVVKAYRVIVPMASTEQVTLAENVIVEGSGGSNKLSQLWHCYQLSRRYIKGGSCDVLSTDPYYLGLLGVWCSWRYGVAHEAVALGFEKFTWLRKQVANFVLHRAHAIRVNSDWLVSFVEEQFGITGAKVHMAPIYVVMDKIGLKDLTEEESAELKKEQDAFNDAYGNYFNVLAVNRLVSDKNIEMQLRAVSALASSFPSLRLHIAGNGPEEENLKVLCTELDITQQVVWHGYTTGMRLGALYTESDCFVLTSNREGWGMVIAEALTAKLPVIMTQVGAAGDLVIDGESGIVIPVGDTEAFTEALLRVMEDDVLRTELVAGGQTSLKSLLTKEEILERYKASWRTAYEMSNKHTNS